MGAVTVNLAGFAGNTGIGATPGAGKGKDGNGQVKNGSIFAGNINNMTNDRIEQKRAMAKKQASKVIMDQFALDCGMTDKIAQLRDRNADINKQISDLQEERKLYVEERDALREKYGMTPESEEEKQLDLIRRVSDSLRPGSDAEVTMDDVMEVSRLRSNLTSYQKRSLGYDAIIGKYDSDIAELQKESQINNATVRELKLAHLKTSYKGISKAKGIADSILDEASREIMGMMWEDAKNHVDEEMEEKVEEAQERKEEKEEQEEKLDAAKERKEGQEELTKAVQESAEELEKMKAEIKKLLREAGLLDDDSKGLMVDGFL